MRLTKLEQLKRNLLEAQAKLDHLNREGPHTLEAFGAAFDDLHSAERALAAAQRQEYAVELDLGVTPEAAISGGRLFTDDYYSFLAFNAMRPRRGGGLNEHAGVAIIELQGCTITKFGHPNDEALPGHRLYHRGLGGYGIYEVHNSTWIEEVVAINRVRFPKTKRSNYGRHFMFVFHDSSFECIARNLSLEVAPFSPRFEKVYDVLKAWWDLEDALRAQERSEESE